MLSNSEITTSLLEALRAGRVCLIPTDTVPGLAFDPTNELAKKTLEALKGRPDNKGYVCLASTPNKAFSYWNKLHGKWEEVLKELWPTTLTTIFFAAETAPKTICREGTVAIRIPKVDNWLLYVLDEMGLVATTSVNATGEPAKVEWEEAVEWCKDKDIYVPMLNLIPQSSKVPSTIIQIHPTHWRVVREGSVTANDIFGTKAMQQEEGWKTSSSQDPKP